MMRRMSKVLFPKLQPDQRRQQMNTLMLIAFPSLPVSGIVAAMVYFSNRH